MHGGRLPSDPEQLVEVFLTDNDILAGLVIDEILKPAGISAIRHERRSRSIMAPSSMPGEIGIAVGRSAAAAARKRLHEARHDGVLHADGKILEEEPA